MANIIVGIGGLAATNNPKDILKTLGLGSCVAIVMLDPKSRTAGLGHLALPDSSIANGKDAQKQPGRFVDTGITALCDKMAEHGAGDPTQFIVKVAGGACMLDDNNTFNIGRRNILAVKKILWEKGMGARAEDVGGNYSRSVRVDLSKGAVWVYSPGKGEWKI